MRRLEPVIRHALFFAAAAALVLALFHAGTAGAEGRTPCRPPKGIVCAPPRPPAPDRSNCRDTGLYPAIKAQVACVLTTNGLGWVWTSGIADCIVWHESRWQPEAVNSSSGALGLWQLLGHGDILARYSGWWGDPVTNTAVAVVLIRAAGLSPWAATKGTCW